MAPPGGSQGGRNLICKGFVYKQGHEEKRIRDFLKPGILKSFSLQSWTLGFSFSNCCPAPLAAKEDRQCGGSCPAGGGRRMFFLIEIVKKQNLLFFPSPYIHTHPRHKAACQLTSNSGPFPKATVKYSTPGQKS